MADLPVLALQKIFDFLSIQEKARLRSTCKTWKLVIETFNLPQSLNIHSLPFPRNQRWCFSNRMVTEDEIHYLAFKGDSNRMFSLRIEFFRNLRNLHLYHVLNFVDELEPFLEELNELPKLKVLMISEGNEPIKRLSLSNIEKLSLSCPHAIELDTPNLNSLVYWNSSNWEKEIKFRFPLKVKHLECLNFTSALSQLKNLETLLCQRIPPDFNLKNFKSLKRLEIWPTEEQLPQMRLVQEQRNRLNRNGMPELVFSGLKEEPVSCARERQLRSNVLFLTPAYLETVEKESLQTCWKSTWSLVD